jgi:Excalibur calcium-binding domain
MKRIAILSGLALVLAAPATSAPQATSSLRNCTALNKVYRYGVGRWGARDHTSGTPVTNFKRSNRLYRANRGLDRDKDGIACEKR